MPQLTENPDPISVTEFAAKIKSKYPQYKDIDDLELAQKMVAKYPQYKDTVSFNAPEERSIFGAIPVIGDVIHYGGKAVENVFENQIPESVATINLQGQSARQKEIQHLQQLQGLTPEQQSGLQYELGEQNIPRLESYIQKQKQESAQKLSGNVQNLSDVNSVSSFMNWMGTSIGQAGGQIPLTATTFGASSFLMEAAEVYDNQLDLLAKKHGISREEVITKGLDKPAEGEAYALLAGSLDVVSAGSIMGLFKNIAKQGVKNLSKDQIKHKILKEAVKDGVFEFFTEGTQGQLEQAGGAAGAGTDYKFNLKQFLNEGASGAVGGAGIGLASSGPQNIVSTITHPSSEAIKAHEDFANSITTGDPTLDATIDELARESALEFDKLFDRVRNSEKEIAGTKTNETIDKILNEYEKTLTEKQSLERQGFLSNLLKQFEESPTVPQVHPVSEENELGPQVDQIAFNKLNPAQTIQPTINQNDTQNQTGLQSPIREGQEPIIGQPVQSTSSPTPQGSGVFQAPPPRIEKTEQKNIKLEEATRIEESKREDERIKLQAMLENALKRAPSRRVSAIESIAEKADKLGLIELRDKATKLADKEIDTQQLKVEDKEIRKSALTKRKTLEERQLELENKKIEKAAKVAFKIVNQPVEGTKVQKGITEAREATIGETKEAFLKEIAYQRHIGNASYKNVAKSYLNFRKKHGLKDITIEQAINKANAEAYISNAKKQVEKESRERGSIQRKIASMKKEGKSVEEISKAHEQFHSELKGQLAKLLGVKQSDIDNISGQNLSEVFGSDVKAITGNKFNKENLKQLTINELHGRLKMHESFRNPFSRSLLKSIEKAAKKAKKEFKIYEYKSNKPGGMHLAGKNLDVLLFTSKALEVGERSESTALHEIIHGYMSFFASSAFSSDESFSRAVNRVYDYGKITYRNNLFNIIDKLTTRVKKLPKDGINMSFKELTKDVLTEEEFNILNASWDYINEFYDNPNQSNYLSNLLINYFDKINLNDDYRKSPNAKYETDYIVKQILESVYGFNNQRELLAEAMSSKAFANLLNQLPYEGNVVKYKNGIKTNTILQKLFTELKNFVNKHIFDKSSVYEELEQVISDYDNLYNSNPLISNEIDPFYKILTIGDLKNMAEFRGKSPKELANYQKFLKEIQSEDESYTADLKKSPLRKKSPDVNKEIIKNISKTLERRKEIKTVNDVKDYILRVNKNLAENRKLGDVFADIAFGKIEAMRKTRSQSIKVYVDKLYQAMHNPHYAESIKFAEDVDDFSLVDLNLLSQDQLSTILKGISDLAQDKLVSPNAYNIMITYGKTLTKKQELLKVAPQIAKKTASFVADWGNPATYASILGRYNKTVANKILKNIYGGLMSTFSNVSLESHNFFGDLNTIADKNGLTHSNLAKIGMYGSIFSTKSDPANTAEWNQEVIENAEFLVAAAQNKIIAQDNSKYKGDLSKAELIKELDIAKDIHSKLVKSPKMESILSGKEQELYNKIRQFAASHENDFQRNSIAVWGNENYEHRFNYFPTLAQGKTEGITKDGFQTDDLLQGPGDNLAEALGIITDKGKNTLYGKKVWSNYKRLNPKGYFYDFDALAISEKWSKRMLFDLYASTEMKALNRLLKDPQFRQEMGEKTIEGFTKQLHSIAGIGPNFRNDIGAVGKFALKVRDNLYTATLATTGQIISQSSSGFASAAVIAANAGVNAPVVFSKAVSATFKSSFTSDTSKLQQFLKENGLGIQLRDILFEKYLTPSDYQNYLKKKSNKIRNSVQNLTEWGLRAGDKLGARIVWFAAYFNAGGTLENPSREAVLEAERWVGMMQNMSDVSFTAPMFKYDSVSKKILMGMFYAFKSFAVNSYINLIYSAKNSGNSREARVVAAGQLANIAAYHAMAVMAVKPLYELVLDSIVGGDDEDDKDKKKFSKAQQIIAESLWDIGAGPLFGMAAPSPLDAISRHLFNATVAPKIYGTDNPFEAFDKYTESPIYSMKELEDVYKEAFGPGGKDIMGTVINAAKLAELYAQSNDYFNGLDKAEKKAHDEDILWQQMAATIFGAAPIVPLRGDLKRLLEANIRRKKAQYLKSNIKGRNSTSGEMPEPGEAGEELEPAFEEKDYELNNDIPQ